MRGLMLTYFCPACAYDLRGATSLRCPECGGDVSPGRIKQMLGRAQWSTLEIVLRLTLLPVLFGLLPQLVIAATGENRENLNAPTAMALGGAAAIVIAGLANSVLLARRLATVQRIEHGAAHTGRVNLGATLGLWCIQLLLGGVAIGVGFLILMLAAGGE